MVEKLRSLTLPSFYRFARGSAILALFVVVLGGYVRLSDAGLGCPDWPGCYGYWKVPDGEQRIIAESRYPQRKLVAEKAWKEMAHRYGAGLLGLSVLALAVWAWFARRRLERGSVWLSTALLLLVVLQSLFGMWTVTLLVQPWIVTSHLLMGLLTLSLLWRLGLPPTERGPSSVPYWWRFAVPLMFVVLFLQTLLGGLTSSHYVALYCPDFPLCNGQWWPQMDFYTGFLAPRQFGIDYEQQRLPWAAGAAIHMTHRLGALVTALLVGGLALWFWLRTVDGGLRRINLCILLLLLLQLGLGVAAVMLALPLPIAVAHNAVAALLWLAVMTLHAWFGGRRLGV